MADTLTLNSKSFRLQLCPAIGGSMTRFQWLREPELVELMRPATDDAIAVSEPLRMSCFPLVPYCDLVTGASFAFGGVRYELPHNKPGLPEPIHGEGWINPWTVEIADAAMAQLSFRHDREEPGFPFSYRAVQVFRLDETGLEVELRLVNADDRPMPAGIGLHPYYVRTPEVTIFAPTPRVWRADAARTGQPAIEVPPEWDFRAERRPGNVDLDHCFAGWEGRYAVTWPETSTRLTVTADPVFGNLLIFIPRNGNHFCVEPISNAMDGFNLAALGLTGHDVSVLQPGHRLIGRVRFHAGIMELA
jgi:aldose 1-epimerase